MPGIGYGLGAAAAEWEIRKEDERQAAERAVEADAVMSNEQALGDITPNPTQISTQEFEGDYHIQDEDHNLGKGYYNPYTKKYGNKAWRNNNPGNITGMGGKLLRGASRIAHNKVGDAGDVAQQVYDTPEQGWSAMAGLMSEKYGEGPIRETFSKWQSNQEAWGNMKNELVARGVNIDKSFNELDPEQKMIVMNNRAQHEGWTGPMMTNPKIFSL